VRYKGHAALSGIDLSIREGEFFSLLGPSGCGKTTTLNIVGGFIRPDGGEVLIQGRSVGAMPSYRRPVNTVFQSYALFPHLDTFENVAFGLRRRGSKDLRRQVEEALELVELAPMARRMPAQLSGGQQQRVALARAIVNRPAVLLLDEPLGALDLKLRRQMQIELKRIQTEVGLTFVHVTHDQEEAMTMADTIAVMDAGRIEQQGGPTELYESPTTTFVANFLGQSNLVRATVTGRQGDDLTLDVHGNRLAMPVSRRTSGDGDLLIGIRPEKIRLAEHGDGGAAGDNALPGAVVTDASFTGVSTQYLVRTPWAQELMVFAQNVGMGGVLRPGTTVDLHWEPAHTFALDGSGDVTAGVEHDEGVRPVPVA
jgi:spermidine/putrescine transport system ATP-binding protein